MKFIENKMSGKMEKEKVEKIELKEDLKREERQKKNITKMILAILFLIGFIYVYWQVFRNKIDTLDMRVYYFIRNNLYSDKMTFVAKGFTFLGSAMFLVTAIIVMIVYLVRKKNKNLGILIFLNTAIITIINQILKFIIRRPRPNIYRIVKANGYSFPSGHSMVSLAFYGYLIYIIYKKLDNKIVKILLTLLLMINILCIGISRIYLGVHYFSDVVGGFLISISYLLIYTNITKESFTKAIKENN